MPYLPWREFESSASVHLPDASAFVCIAFSSSFLLYSCTDAGALPRTLTVSKRSAIHERLDWLFRRYSKNDSPRRNVWARVKEKSSRTTTRRSFKVWACGAIVYAGTEYHVSCLLLGHAEFAYQSIRVNAVTVLWQILITSSQIQWYFIPNSVTNHHKSPFSSGATQPAGALCLQDCHRGSQIWYCPGHPRSMQFFQQANH